jgi:hypothetical protein
MSSICYNAFDFESYIPLNRNGNNLCMGMRGNVGNGRGGKGYRGYNGAYYGIGNIGGGWSDTDTPEFIYYDSFKECNKCGYCLDEKTLFG